MLHGGPLFFVLLALGALLVFFVTRRDLEAEKRAAKVLKETELDA